MEELQHKVALRSGATLPALGQGTWYLGDDPAIRDREKAALRAGIDAGMTLVDTAEMYGDGRAEELVADVLRDGVAPRSKLYLVSKVLPWNAGLGDITAACDGSLARLGVDHLDLYLLHWRGSVPLAETVQGLQELRESGRIRAWGVSNFDVDDMEELWSVPGGSECAVNQVLYHVGSRGVETGVGPWMAQHGVAMMAYCPLAQAGRLRDGLFSDPTLTQIAQAHGATVPQVMLAWAIRDGRTVAIPRTGRAEHAVANAGADAVELTADDLAAIDAAWPVPTGKVPLDAE